MDSVNALMAGLIDYAGLFPPAELGMKEAVANYAEYLKGPDSAWLGKFILPVDRFAEFEESARTLLPTRAGKEPWRVSALVKKDVRSGLAEIAGFDSAHTGAKQGRARVEAIELPFSCLPELTGRDTQDGIRFDTYVELASTDDIDTGVLKLKQAGVRAKLRMGGVTPTAFPTAFQVVHFLRACCNAGIAFKATAGLHHPLRAQFPLTYEPESSTAMMFGFLNVFLAAAFMWNGADDVTAARILNETDPSAFAFGDSAISWLGNNLSVNRIAESRRAFATSFGSCSFREPVDELKLLLSGAVAA